ncbi:MAG TPA: TIGR03067 domain-containing protein, partial [Urbifossiella sp.]|nr:TIGR03067 domain-containing protein [Urbifossiella sp.]
EWRAALDEELGRLPEVYRTVVVLCDLEGRTRREAAGLLGCPEGTVAGRLSRARDLLAKRLARYAPAVSVAAVLSGTASARVPASLVSTTIQVASLVSPGRPAAGPIPATVAALTEGVMNAMLMSKLKAAAAVVLIVGLLATGAVALVDHRASAQGDKTPVAEERATPPRKDEKASTAPDKELGDLQGEWVVVAIEGDGRKASADDVKGMRWAIKGNEITGRQPGGDGKMSFRLNPGATPKEIDVTSLDGNQKGTTSPGIYAIDGPKLRVCFGEKVRPKVFATAPGDDRTMLTLEKEAFTAWGEEVGGLQAGLEVKGRKTYRLGETITLLVRVRNAGKEAVKFEYIRQFLDEHPPGVTGADGKSIPQATSGVTGIVHVPVGVSLEPGEDVVLGTRIHGTAGVPYELWPSAGGGPPASQNHPLRVGAGKVTLRYERVFGNSSIGSVKIAPRIAGLATGKLELQVTAQDAPAGPAARPPEGTRPRFSVHLSKSPPWPSGSRCAFLDDGRILVHAGPGSGDANEVHSGLQVRAANDGKLLKSITVKGQFVGDFRLSADRKWVAAVTTADTTGTFTIPSPGVTVWDAATWKVRGTIGGHDLLDVAADGRTVLVREDDGWGAASGRVEVWDVVERKRLRAAPFEFKRIDAGALSPDGSLAVVSGLNEVAYWKWRAGDGHDRLRVGRTVVALAFSPDGRLVAEGPGPRMTVEVRDVTTLKVARTLSDPGQPRVPLMTAGLTFADAGKTLLLGNGVGLIETIPVPHRILGWDVGNGTLIRQIDMKGGSPYSLDVSPDGKTLAVMTADNGVSLRAWDLDRMETPR